MRNRDLAADYARRAEARLRAVDALFEAQSWADVVSESQEVVELALKGALRAAGVEPQGAPDEWIVATRQSQHDELSRHDSLSQFWTANARSPGITCQSHIFD